MFQPGDRVRWETMGDDGLPLVLYGYVGGCNGDATRASVMLDGDLSGNRVVDLDQLAPVTITNVELHLMGADLLDDPALRQGLVNLWSAEADQAGLEVVLEPLGAGLPDGNGFSLAQLWSGNDRYVLRASWADARDSIHVRAHPTAW